jgi:predicted enzyme related to lactoylglutathione lyase
VFGWSDEPKDLGPMGTYHVQMLGDKQVGGLMKNPMPGAPTGWVVYFFVLDLTAATQKAKQLGATPIMEGMPIPGIGSFSMLTDPTGAMFTLFQPMMNNC